MAYNHNASSICFGDAGPAPTRTAARAGGQGGSQNTDNTLGDVPSVRLYAPPGGASSISFGGGDAAPAPRAAPSAAPWGTSAPAPAAYQPPPAQAAPWGTSAPAPAPAAAYQPYGGQGGQHRTASRGASQGGSQNTNNTIGDVPSVKLYAPPGGASQISFGGYDPAPVRAAPPPMQQQYQPPPAAYQPPPAAYQPSHAPAQAFGGDGIGDRNSGRTAARGASQGGSQNVGNTIGSVPSVKLHAPPGGASSISFG